MNAPDTSIKLNVLLICIVLIEAFFLWNPLSDKETQIVTIVGEQQRCKEMGGDFGIYQNPLTAEVNMTCLSKSINLFKN